MATETALNEYRWEVIDTRGRRIYKNLMEGEFFYFWIDTKGRVDGFVDRLAIRREGWTVRQQSA